MRNQPQYTFTSQPINISINTSPKEDNMSKDEMIACHATDAVFERASKKRKVTFIDRI